jgi:AAHS family 4-hydroxybenzoate transporter-like MFS transporter
VQLTSDGPSGGLIERSKFGPLQISVIVLCALVALLDGFDTQAIAYVAPRIAQDWGVPPSSFGPIFSAGLVGLMLGAFIFGPVADRIGRKTVILFATAAFGLFALLTATAASLDQLLLYRLLTGVGLGAAMPNMISLTSEYAPARLRATAVMIMFCGFPLGSTIGGLIAGPLMEVYGWQGVFVMGGVVPLILLPVLMFALPESVRFLAMRGRSEARIGKVLRRIDPQASTADFIAEIQAESGSAAKGFSVLQLFKEGRAPGTLLLWVTFFMNLLVMYFLVNWLPTLIRESGLPLNLAILSSAILNLGGVVGAIILARMIDRWSPFAVLGAAYAVSAVFIVLIAYGATSAPVMLTAAALAGFGIVGGQIGCNAVAAALYPTAIRSTGVGWALGFGRIGAILGPLIGGALLAGGWTPKAIITIAAAPALAAGAAVFLLGAIRPKS